MNPSRYWSSPWKSPRAVARSLLPRGWRRFPSEVTAQNDPTRAEAGHVDDIDSLEQHRPQRQRRGHLSGAGALSARQHLHHRSSTRRPAPLDRHRVSAYMGHCLRIYVDYKILHRTPPAEDQLPAPTPSCPLRDSTSAQPTASRASVQESQTVLITSSCVLLPVEGKRIAAGRP